MISDFEASARGLKAWRFRVPKGHAPSVMKDISAEARSHGSVVLILRADKVFGLDHLVSALAHAMRALEQGTASADSLEMETLLYASGERQLNAAIAKMAVDETTEVMVVASLKGEKLQAKEGWAPMETTVRATAADLKGFGITDSELSTVSEDRWSDLVLERVAAVDILKR